MGTKAKRKPPSPAEVSRHAYDIWEREGRPHGRDFDHWLQAEAELDLAGARPRARKAREKTGATKAKGAARKKGASKASRAPAPRSGA